MAGEAKGLFIWVCLFVYIITSDRFVLLSVQGMICNQLNFLDADCCKVSHPWWVDVNNFITWNNKCTCSEKVSAAEGCVVFFKRTECFDVASLLIYVWQLAIMQSDAWIYSVLSVKCQCGHERNTPIHMWMQFSFYMEYLHRSTLKSILEDKFE